MSYKYYNTMEIYKDVVGYEGIYRVSNFGNIYANDGIRSGYSYRSKQNMIRKYRGKVLNPGNCRGYKIVTLTKNGIRKTFQVHRLVATAFIKNIENKPNINHIDFNTSNNNYLNLEWCTQYENIHHTINNGRDVHVCGEKNGMSKLKNSQVYEIFELRKTGLSQKSIAKIFNLDQSAISLILSKKRQKNNSNECSL